MRELTELCRFACNLKHLRSEGVLGAARRFLPNFHHDFRMMTR